MHPRLKVELFLPRSLESNILRGDFSTYFSGLSFEKVEEWSRIQHQPFLSDHDLEYSPRG